MNEQLPPAVGTVAQEVARLLEEMATMAPSRSSRSEDPRPYSREPADVPPPPPPPETPDGSPLPDDSAWVDEPSDGACSQCGRDSDEATQTPAACRLCPLCRGIALLRSVRPETVDLLADLALALAATLRDVATRSRASDPAPSSTPAPGRPPEGDRAKVQDIPVDDESEG